MRAYTCADCGGPVSRRVYRRCQSCHLRAIGQETRFDSERGVEAANRKSERDRVGRVVLDHFVRGHPEPAPECAACMTAIPGRRIP